MVTRLTKLMGLAAMLAAVDSLGHGQEASETSLEVTIRLLPENAVGPEEITRRIELPRPEPRAPSPRAQPDERPPPGAENGNGRGQDVAAEARERGRAFGQEVAEQARENRENAGRPDDPGPPADRPQGPPVTPPGQ